MPADKPLHKACHNGDLGAVRSAIESGETDVNEPGAGDRRPLHRAAGSNHADICTFLIAQGAIVDQVRTRASLRLAVAGPRKCSSL